MGYALFANRKLVLDSQLNSLQLQQTQRSNTQFALANDNLQRQQKLSALQTNQSNQLQPLYQSLADSTSDAQRSQIQAQIENLQNTFDGQLQDIQREIDQVAIKENCIEMEVKHLDTQVSAIEKQLEAVEQAEGAGITRATPKFKAQG